MLDTTSNPFDMDISYRGRRIHFYGDLEDVPAARKLLEEICVCAGAARSHWTIDTGKLVRMPQDGLVYLM